MSPVSEGESKNNWLKEHLEDFICIFQHLKVIDGVGGQRLGHHTPSGDGHNKMTRARAAGSA